MFFVFFFLLVLNVELRAYVFYQVPYHWGMSPVFHLTINKRSFTGVTVSRIKSSDPLLDPSGVVEDYEPAG